MRAETLRRAAGLMRDRAEAATTFRKFDGSGTPIHWVGSPHGDVHDDFTSWICDSATGETADHIASWHPAVALAVADWLGSVAMDVDKRDNPKRVGGVYEALRIPDEFAALAVARAYLGES